MESIAETMNECPICYEVLDSNKNLCNTPCGHVFCFGCMVKCLSNGNTCPCCRGVLSDKSQENDEDDDEDDDDEDDDDEDDDSDGDFTLEDESDMDDEDDAGCRVEHVEKMLKQYNITYLDLVSILINRSPDNTTKQMKKTTESNIYDLISGLDEEWEQEQRENDMMGGEDKGEVVVDVVAVTEVMDVVVNEPVVMECEMKVV